MKKIKWGILGAGWIADKFVSDFKLVDNGEVVAVGARSKERADEFAQRFNIAKAYGSYDELVMDDDVDIIYIATTHNFHFDHSILCLEHKKHVLCEKPATVNAKEFEQIMYLAKKQNLFYMEAMWTLFLPSVKQALKWVAEGEIGDVEVVQANFGFPANPAFKDRLFDPNLAGGALLDIGIYPLTIIELFAAAKLKHYEVSSSFTETKVDETLAIQMEYENGVKAQLVTSIKNRLKNDAFICGSKGFIQIPNFWMSKKAILTIGEEETTFIDDTETMGYNYEVVAINEDLLNKKTENSIMPMQRTKKMMELMDSIRRKINLVYPFE